MLAAGVDAPVSGISVYGFDVSDVLSPQGITSGAYASVGSPEYVGDLADFGDAGL